MYRKVCIQSGAFVFPTRHCSLVFPKSTLLRPHMDCREIPKAKSDSRIRQKEYICHTAELTAASTSKTGNTCSTHSKRDARTGQWKRVICVLRRPVQKDRARAQKVGTNPSPRHYENESPFYTNRVCPSPRHYEHRPCLQTRPRIGTRCSSTSFLTMHWSKYINQAFDNQ